MCVHVCVCMCVCGRACVCVCACACMHVHARACACSYIRALHGADAKVGRWGKPTHLLGPAPKWRRPTKCTFSCIFFARLRRASEFLHSKNEKHETVDFPGECTGFKGVLFLKKFSARYLKKNSGRLGLIANRARPLGFCYDGDIWNRAQAVPSASAAFGERRRGPGRRPVSESVE